MERRDEGGFLIGSRRWLWGGLAVALIALGTLYVLRHRPSADVFNDLQTRMKAARVTFEQQNFQAAASVYEKLVSDVEQAAPQLNRPGHSGAEDGFLAEGYTYWALSLLNSKSYDKATAVAQTYLTKVSSPDASFFVIYGNILRLSGKTDEAIAQYQRALSRSDKDPAASLDLADVYVDQGKLADAKTLIDGAITKANQEPVLYYMQAHILDLQGDTAGAATARATALKLEGANDPTITVTQPSATPTAGGTSG